MLKNISQIEVKVTDKFYHFNCDSSSSIEHVKEAIFQIQKIIAQIEDNIKAQQVAQAGQKAPETSPTPEIKQSE